MKFIRVAPAKLSNLTPTYALVKEFIIYRINLTETGDYWTKADFT